MKGRPPILSRQWRRSLKVLARQCPEASNDQLAAIIEERGGPCVHRTTIGNHLKSLGFFRRKARLVPLLTDRHKAARLEWCKKNRDRDWTQVFFSDESRNLWGIIKQRLSKCQRTTVSDWKQKILEVWESVDDDLIHSLIESMPRRIEQCIAAAGGHTKY